MQPELEKKPDRERNRKRKKRCRPGEKDRKRSSEKRRERQNLGHSFVKEGGALKDPLENSGEFCLLVLHYVPTADFMGTNQNQKRGIKLVSAELKCFTLNEKQIFEQMEVFFFSNVACLAALRYHSFMSIAFGF